MSEQKELLIQFNESGFRNQVEILERFTTFFESCINDFNQLGFGSFEEDNFSELFLQPKTFLFKALMKDKPSSLGGMPLSKEKLYDIIEKPSGFERLISKIQGLDEMVKTIPNYYKFKFTDSLDSFLDYFTFLKGKIKMTNETVQRIKYANEIYVSKESSKKIYTFINKLKDVFNESEIFGPGFLPPTIRSGGDIHKFLPYDDVTRKFHVDVERVKTFDLDFVNK